MGLTKFFFILVNFVSKCVSLFTSFTFRYLCHTAPKLYQQFVPTGVRIIALINFHKKVKARKTGKQKSFIKFCSTLQNIFPKTTVDVICTQRVHYLQNASSQIKQHSIILQHWFTPVTICTANTINLIYVFSKLSYYWVSLWQYKQRDGGHIVNATIETS